MAGRVVDSPAVRGRSVLAWVLVACLAAPTGGCASLSPMERAESQVRRNENDAAIATLRSHLARHPDDVAARSLLVRVYALASRPDLARAECDELARRLPKDSPRPAIELGHAYELGHDYEKALASYDDASAIAPTAPEGPRTGGLRAARWGEVEIALPRLEEAFRRGARDAELLHALGLARVHEGRLDDAESAYRLALSLHPDAVDSMLGLATLALLKKDYASALGAYDKLVAARPASPQASLGRAFSLAKLGRRAEASKELDRAEALGAPRANVARQRALVAAP